MIKKFENIINDFKEEGYICDYFPGLHSFILEKTTDQLGWSINSISVDYRHKNIRFDGYFNKNDLNLVKRLIECLEEKPIIK